MTVSFAGDLVNQIVPTHYVFREFNIPFFGIYGACSTSMESLLLSSIFVDSDSAKVALAATSSHNSTAERQSQSNRIWRSKTGNGPIYGNRFRSCHRQS
ncbi:MAG: hypothetical protein ACLRQX_06065 [Turicibacter sanguinis]